MNLGLRAFEYVKYFSETIGSRPIGTFSNEKTALYIQNLFHSYLNDSHSQIFDTYDWKVSESFVEVNGQRLAVRPDPFSSSVEVFAEIVPVCTVEELRIKGIRDKIVVLTGDLAKEPMTPKGFLVYNPEHHKNIIRLLEEQKPKAIISIHQKENWNDPIFKDWDFHIPSCSVQPSIGKTLLTTKKVRVSINTEMIHSKARNIIATKHGAEPTKIVIMAHLDTVYGTNGAFDNASGLGVLMTLVEEISKINFNSTFEFIAFNSEEYQGMGDQVYIESRDNDFSDIKLAINIDGVGLLTGTNTVSTIGCSKELTNEVEKIKGVYPGIKSIEPWYESNHSTFLFRGVPTIPFNCIGGDNIIHQLTDTIDHISPQKLNEILEFILKLINTVDQKDKSWYFST